MEGEGSPGAKRMRLSSPYSCGGKNKACIVFYCREFASINQLPEETRIECNICIVDLKSDHSIDTLDDDADFNSDNPVGGMLGSGEVDALCNKDFARVSPTFQIDCGVGGYPPNDAFCVLGEKLYMFEGSSIRAEDCIKKSVFAIDLSESLTLTRETTKLEKGGPLLKKIGEMLSPKVDPVAIATPDGKKIVVLPTWWPHDIHKREGKISSGGFEIFDPTNPESPPEPLPPITDSYCTQIDRHGFIEGTDQLLVQISYGSWNAGFRVLDLALPNKEWAKLDRFYGVLDFIPPLYLYQPSFFETVGERRFCFVNRHGLCDLEDFFHGNHVVDDFPEFRVPGESEFVHREDRSTRMCLFDVDTYVARCLTEEDDGVGGDSATSAKC